MAKRMLIDATHREETRVVVLNGNRLEEYDFETSTKKQLKGNIYLAKVTRVEPSLQACFVEFGGGRHGFLAFNEIHPDYWRIPIADREALLAEERRLAEREEREERDDRRPRDDGAPQKYDAPDFNAAGNDVAIEPLALDPATGAIAPEPSVSDSGLPTAEAQPLAFDAPRVAESTPAETAAPFEVAVPLESSGEPSADAAPEAEPSVSDPTVSDAAPVEGEAAPAHPPLESVGGGDAVADEDDDDDDEREDGEQAERRRRFKPMRHYKIQEVIKRRQVLLVQVVKEERGTKGAALTTYISLAGRYCVLMPNTMRGGGISRRITSAQDRKRLKEIMQDLQVPDGMAVILRTAGMERSMQEIRRDYEYLMRMWDDVRELTLQSTAPALVYEEGSLIKRSMRDIYSRDVDEVLVEGREGYESARAFMTMLMPGHAEKIRLYDDPAVPLFQRFQVETQLEEMHEATVRLRSGGYIVINPTEALVAIDVNSGRSTRERDIEGTALKTNVEAAEEIARQLRLRDLAGLIVIDFIDMEDNRHIAQVERRMKEAMRTDRARIQIGRISPFGLLELSRQRLRPSLIESSTQKCPHCDGTGHIRSTESSALALLRALEEEGMKGRTAELQLRLPSSVAVYLLNNKRVALASIEQRYGLTVAFEPDDSLIPPAYKLERVRQRERADGPPAPVRAGDESFSAPGPAPIAAEPGPGIDDVDADRSAPAPFGAPAAAPAEPGGERDDRHARGGRRRRRRGRGRGREDGAPAPQPAEASGFAAPAPLDAAPGAEVAGDEGAPRGEPTQPRAADPGRGDREGEGDGNRRRRGRRGGRRRRGRDGEGNGNVEAGREIQPFAAQAAPESAPTQPSVSPDDDLRARARELYAQDARYPIAAAVPPPPSGDAHEWPWNRPGDAPQPVAPPRSVAPPESEVVAPPPVAAAAPPTPTPEPVRSPAPVIEPANASEPKGPPKQGWWRRLTS